MTVASVKSGLKRLGFRTIQWVANRAGFAVIRHGYSSPVPDLRRLDPAHWSSVLPLPGINLRMKNQLDLLAELQPYIDEFHSLLVGEDVFGFAIANGMYGPIDAELLFGVIRRARPRRIVEVGSGNSTLIAARALESNRREGDVNGLTSIDPEPRLSLPKLPGHRHVQGRVQDVGASAIAELAADDILFVDSSHVVRMGADVNFLILEVLPRLAPGVLVHFHDVFMPWDYPRSTIEHGKYWSEQYLLQAFLSGNPSYEVMLSALALARQSPDEFPYPRAAVAAIRPGAFWIRSSSADRV